MQNENKKDFSVYEAPVCERVQHILKHLLSDLQRKQ